jgi:hypothetical protein
MGHFNHNNFLKDWATDYKAMRFPIPPLKYNADTNSVFNNAEQYIDNVKSDYMYMYSDDTSDFFKRIDSKKYQHAPKSKACS